jgi:hypothetical protein
MTDLSDTFWQQGYLVLEYFSEQVILTPKKGTLVIIHGTVFCQSKVNIVYPLITEQYH